MEHDRPFDITILGATGWTATICAEHIARTQPTTLRWCIAGRSPSKLEALAAALQHTNPSRNAPRIFTLADLSPSALAPLIRQTKVLINGVGPYHLHSSPVVAACAAAGTHYLDFATETPWVRSMIAAHSAPARASGALLIPCTSLSSAPSDLLAWLLVAEAGPRIEVAAAARLNMQGMQGGSAETLLCLAERYGTSCFRARSERCRCEPALGGALVPAPFTGAANEAVVARSAARSPEVYGPDFVYREYAPVGGRISAMAFRVCVALGIWLLAWPWFRALVRARIAFAPGTGPDREESRRAESAEFRAVAFARGERRPLARSEFRYKGALTDVSAILAVEAAAVLLEAPGESGPGKGGFRTPSTLGMPFVERLRKAGVQINVEKLA
ncbi:hypothetical protein F4810DRAFT_704436 [Camillea tinctor]|nr:hypothetical protein F4810DRAFT_704436 [Camillea tinctor]